MIHSVCGFSYIWEENINAKVQNYAQKSRLSGGGGEANCVAPENVVKFFFFFEKKVFSLYTYNYIPFFMVA